MNPENNFLSQKYDDLHKSKEVERATDTTDEQVEQSKEARIQAYLDRIKKILNSERPGGKTGADLLENKLVNDYVLDTSDEELMEELARDLYESERQIAMERGQGDEIQELEDSDIDVLEEYRETLEEKRQIQENTLQPWINYLKENDADYPMWFRYYVMRSLRDMDNFDRDNMRYDTRTEKTVAPFPEMNAEALAWVYEAIETQLEIEDLDISDDVQEDIVMNTELTDGEVAQIEENAPERVWEQAKESKLKKKRNEKRKEWLQEHKEEKYEEYTKQQPLDEERGEELGEELIARLEGKDFSKLYAFAQVEAAGSIERITTEGEWKKYEQGSDPEMLKQDLKGKGTGWCTAQGTFAADQLEHGDFYVYYTYNSDGEPTEPRVAIRQERGEVAEVRGVDEEQQLEPELIDIAKDKYGDMPGAEKYEKASEDMKRMTEIYEKCFREDSETGKKIYLDPELSKDELRFLYEIDEEIESFGYGDDPRISSLKAERNLQEDLMKVFSAEDITDLLKKVTHADKEELVLNNPEKVNFDEQVFKDILIENGKGVRLWEFKKVLFPDQDESERKIDLSDRPDLINNLIKNNQQYLLFGTVSEFPNEFDLEYIDGAEAFTMALKDELFVPHLTTSSRGRAAERLRKSLVDRFNIDPESDSDRIIEGLINSGNENFVWFIEVLKNIDTSDASKLIESGNVAQVASNIDKFSEPEEFSEKLISELRKSDKVDEPVEVFIDRLYHAGGITKENRDLLLSDT